MIQYPAISSLVSANGPSTTVLWAPENLIRAPLELDWSPARSNSTPAFISSSLYLPIAERSTSLGILPASESLLAFTIIMNRMDVAPLIGLELTPESVEPAELSLYSNVEWEPVKSTWNCQMFP